MRSSRPLWLDNINGFPLMGCHDYFLFIAINYYHAYIFSLTVLHFFNDNFAVMLKNI